MSEISKGDQVQLKSGGPIMTVQDVGDYSGSAYNIETGAMCVWFDSKHNPMERVFDVETLQVYKDEDDF